MKIRTIAHKRLVVGEKKQRFGFRKTILGLCGAILGSTLLMADVANNAHTVHAAEFDLDQTKSVQKGNNTANGLNGKVGQPLAKKEVPQLNSSLKQDEKAGADKNQGADKGATGTGADKSGSQLGSQTGAQGAGKGTQGTGTGADKGAQGDKSADVAGKYVPNQNHYSKDTHSEVTGKTDSTSPSSSSAVKTETTSVSKALPTDKEALTHVTKDNFLAYFSLNGSATYDQNTGIVTITPDEYNKVGNFSLKSKIDMNTSFTLTGQVNLGSNSPYGADGIGVAFHNGNTTDIGNAGGNLGIGGLQNALGFKLDTWTNTYKAPLSDKDGSQIDPTDSNGFGWNGDSMNAPYGTFVKTENDEVPTDKDKTKTVQRWWAKDVPGTSQALSKSDVNGQFHDFTVDYDGDTRTLTIKYTPTDGKVLTWTTTVPNSDQEMAMIVSASTGGAKNLQQFKIISFGFKRAATVNVKYVDTKGKQIAQGDVTYPNGAKVNGTYTTGQLEIPGYTFVRMDDGTATGAKSLPATGSLTKAGDNGTVIYVYAPNAEKANVTYIDDTTGKTLSTKDLTGNYGSTDPYRTNDTIAGYENAGYKLVSDNYPTSGVTYKEDGTVQSFQVHLTHSTTPVGPNNPEKPGEPINPDNPNGPKWPDGTDKNSLTQTITRTVNYYDKQTKAVVAKQVTEQVTYNRTAIVDKVTGQIIGYSTTGGNTVDQTDGSKAWIAKDSDTNWAAVTSPDLSSEGYTAPDKAVVAQTTVNPGDENASVDVYYNHVVVPVNPSNPETPGEPINPDNPNGPKWPDGTDKNSLTKTVNQTIHYQYVGGQTAAPDKTDSTTFDHQVEVDKVTGKIVKDDGWSAENDKTSFDAKVSPVIAGYTASQASSTAVTGLTQDSQDNVQTIVYAPNAETANVTYIDDTTGKTLSTKDLTGNYGSTDPYRTNDTIAGYENAGY
ncbi:lectin-like domain-containing protein, partial [Lactobacillus helveticus]